MRADEKGKFTVAFFIVKNLKYPIIIEYFSKYSKTVPVLSRGYEGGKVLISFDTKEEASSALSKNIQSENYQMLSVIPACRSSN